MADLPPEMAELLGSLQTEGKMDSSGIFTLDMSKALPKLSKFQLPQPHYYIPKLVMAAVAARATWVDVRINEYRVAITFDGDPIHEKEMRGLLSYLLQPPSSETRHLRHLASAMNTAVGLEARAVHLASGPGRDVTCQRWIAADRAPTFKLDKPWAAHEVRTRFHLQRGLADMSSKWWHTAGKADILDLIVGHDRALTPEQAELKARVAFCPIPVKLNGRLLNKPVFGQPAQASALDRWTNAADYWRGVHARHHLIEWLIEVEGATHCHLTAPASTASLFERKTLSPEEAPAGCVLALEMGRRRFADTAGKNARVTLVLDGVTLAQRQFGCNTYGGVALMSAEGVQLDASEFKPAEGAMAPREEWLRTMFARMESALKDRAEELRLPKDAINERLTW